MVKNKTTCIIRILWPIFCMYSEIGQISEFDLQCFFKVIDKVMSIIKYQTLYDLLFCKYISLVYSLENI